MIGEISGPISSLPGSRDLGMSDEKCARFGEGEGLPEPAPVMPGAMHVAAYKLIH
jgi:hypothetical protein